MGWASQEILVKWSDLHPPGGLCPPTALKGVSAIRPSLCAPGTAACWTAVTHPWRIRSRLLSALHVHPAYPSSALRPRCSCCLECFSLRLHLPTSPFTSRPTAPAQAAFPATPPSPCPARSAPSAASVPSGPLTQPEILYVHVSPTPRRMSDLAGLTAASPASSTVPGTGGHPVSICRLMSGQASRLYQCTCPRVRGHSVAWRAAYFQIPALASAHAPL